MLGLAALPAQADLIFTTDITVSGSGLGAVYTLVTGHETTPPGSESGCVYYSGGVDVFGGNCPGAGYIAGGDEIANGPGGTVLLSDMGLSSNQGGSVGVVFNVSETGGDKAVDLEALALWFYDAGGNLVYTATLDAADIGTYGKDTGTGLGGSGQVFILDATQAAAVNALSVYRVGGGFNATNTNDGNETLYAFSVPGATTPEPTALSLFGLALFGAAHRLRRRKSA